MTKIFTNSSLTIIRNKEYFDIARTDGTIIATIWLTSTGRTLGEEIAQLFITAPAMLDALKEVENAIRIGAGKRAIIKAAIESATTKDFKT